MSIWISTVHAGMTGFGCTASKRLIVEDSYAASDFVRFEAVLDWGAPKWRWVMPT
jgi:hypothetical protein